MIWAHERHESGSSSRHERVFRVPRSGLSGFRARGTVWAHANTLQDNAFDFCLWIGGKVHEKPQTVFCNPKIIENLSNMFRRKRLRSLEFDNYRPVAEKVGNICLFNGYSFVGDYELRLGDEGYLPCGEFAFKALLVNLFSKSVAHFAVNLEYGALDGVNFIGIEDLLLYIVLHGGYCSNNAVKMQWACVGSAHERHENGSLSRHERRFRVPRSGLRGFRAHGTVCAHERHESGSSSRHERVFRVPRSGFSGFRAPKHSFGSNFCAGSKSNSRLAPSRAQGANRTVVWHHAECGERIERSFGSMQGAGSKSNSFLAPPRDGGHNRTVI